MLKRSGERQVSPVLDGIRDDHKARYVWALDRIPQGAVALDAGCGVGYGSVILAERCSSVISVDISPEAIDYARRFWSRPNIQFSIQNLLCLELDKEVKLDAVVAFEVIEHLTDPQLFLMAARRWLKPDGRMFLSMPNERAIPHTIALNPFHIRHYTNEEIVDLASRSGYRLIERAGQNRETGEIIADADDSFHVVELAFQPGPKMVIDNALLHQALSHSATAIVARANLIKELQARIEKLTAQVKELDRKAAASALVAVPLPSQEHQESERDRQLTTLLDRMIGQNEGHATRQDHVLQSLMSRVKEVEQRHDESVRALVEQSGSSTSLKLECHVLNQARDRLTAELQHYMETNARLDQRLSDAGRLNDEITLRIQELGENYDRLLQENAAHELGIEKMAAEVEQSRVLRGELEAKLSRSTIEVADLRANIDRELAERADLQSRLEACLAIQDQVVRDLDEARSAAQSLALSQENVEADRAQLRRKVDDAELVIKTLTDNAVDIERSRQNAVDDRNGAHQRCAELEILLKANERKTDEIAAALASATSEVIKQHRGQAASADRITCLTAAIETLTENLAEAERDKTDLSTSLKAAREDAKRLQAVVTSAETALKDLQVRHLAVEAEIADLSGKSKLLAADRDSQRDANMVLLARIAELSNPAIKDQLAVVKDQLAAVKDQLSASKTQLSDFTNQLSASEQRTRDLQSELDACRQFNHGLKSKLTEATRPILKEPPTIGGMFRRARKHNFYGPFLFRAIRNSLGLHPGKRKKKQNNPVSRGA